MLFQYIAQRKAGLKPRHSRQPRKFFLVQTAVVVDAGNARHQHVIVLAGHQVAGHYIAAVPHRCFKLAQYIGRLALQRHANVHGFRLAQQTIVHNSPIAANGARSLKA